MFLPYVKSKSSALVFPPSLKSDMFLIAEADNGVTHVSNVVSQWNDQSDDNNHFKQTVENDKPTLIATDSDFNDLPVIEFDGITNDMLTDAFSSELSQPNTIFVVGKYLGSATNRPIYDGITSSKRHLCRTSIGVGLPYEIFAGQTVTVGVGMTITDAHILAVQWNNGPSKGYFNGGSIDINGVSVGTHGLTGLRLCADFNGNFNGNFRVAGFYGSKILMSASQMNLLGGYINEKFGLSWSNVS